MGRMEVAIRQIKESSDQTARIIKTIDEIAFQTNLLALNAAVEAARAGDAGKGFAVVAEEVRNLAQRSAEAARSTSELIEASQERADAGVNVTREVQAALKDVNNSVEKVLPLIKDVSNASNEQSRGIDQVNEALSQMDGVTQSNASNAEENSAAGEELSSQAESMNAIVETLMHLIYGAGSEARLEQLSSGRTNGHLALSNGSPVRKNRMPARPLAGHSHNGAAHALDTHGKHSQRERPLNLKERIQADHADVGDLPPDAVQELTDADFVELR